MVAKLVLSSFMTGPEFSINNCQRFNPVYSIVKRERERDGCLIEWRCLLLRLCDVGDNEWVWSIGGKILVGKTEVKVKVKWFRYRPGVAQRMGRSIALRFHDRGSRSRWVVSCTPRPLFTPGKDTVPIVQEAGWAPGSVWTGGKSRPHRDSIPGPSSPYLVAIPTEVPGKTEVLEENPVTGKLAIEQTTKAQRGVDL